ncbi:MAG TPA: hypothetical protein VN193_00030 [Candidatus Angelobacter sp.]|nr:hypothetical protein [Candidatus Angelobacter sp.]
MNHGRRLRILALIAAALTAPLAATMHASAFTPRVPPGSLGVNAQFLMGFAGPLTPAQKSAQLDEVRALGIGLMRMDAEWQGVEPVAPDLVTGAHTYHWNALDLAVSLMAQHGIQWAPIVDYGTTWASATNDEFSPPRDDTAWSAYASALAHRYGPGGSFWSTNPTLPYLPVKTWEIWNEQNAGFWNYPRCETHTVGVDIGPQRYADLFMSARAAITAFDPAARIMVGGLVPITTPSSSACTVQEFLAGMRAHRSDLAVDVIAVHIYDGRGAGAVLSELAVLRHTIDSLGWTAGIPFDLNENGWPVGGNGFGMTDQQRGDMLATVADQALRSNCNVTGYVPHTWLTAEQNPANGEDWFGVGNPVTPSSPHGSAIAYGSMVQTLQGTGSTAPDPSTVVLC